MKNRTQNKNVALLSGFIFLILSIPGAFLGVNAQIKVTERVVEDNIRSELVNFRIVQVVEGLEHPWAISWLPDGRMLVTERPGRMQLIDGSTITHLKNLPPIHYQEDQRTAPQGGSQAGLLDVVVHPDYENNGWIYFTYSSPGDADGVNARRATGTALARAQLNSDASDFTNLETLYTLMPRTQPGRHYGSRIVFPGDGTVMFSIGDRGLRYPAQQLTNPAGSIIRLLEDGGAPPDNPFVNVFPGNLRPEIYSFGHRNNQGLAQNPLTGEIWATDHGPNGGDQLYQIEKGNNHGWPNVAFGKEYSTSEHIGIGKEAPGVKKPAWVWENSMAPSGLTFYNAEPFQDWNGHLLAGSLIREEIYRIVLDYGKVTHKETLLTGKIGRIRDIRQGPDGFVYIATDETNGGIYRLEPVR